MTKQKVLPKRYDIIDANDPDCNFRINIDVLNEVFGAGRSMFLKGAYPDKKDEYITCMNTGEECFVWLPKLHSNSSEWKNSISADGTEIYEVAEGSRNQDWTEYQPELINRLRIVFVKPSDAEPWKFVGVFRNKRMDNMDHTYERIATKVALVGDPVYAVTLLDDVRK